MEIHPRNVSTHIKIYNNNKIKKKVKSKFGACIQENQVLYMMVKFFS